MLVIHYPFVVNVYCQDFVTSRHVFVWFVCIFEDVWSTDNLNASDIPLLLTLRKRSGTNHGDLAVVYLRISTAEKMQFKTTKLALYFTSAQIISCTMHIVTWNN